MIHVIQCNIAVITTFLFSVGKYLHRLFMVYWGYVKEISSSPAKVYKFFSLSCKILPQKSPINYYKY